jgi:hypothetical protein
VTPIHPARYPTLVTIVTTNVRTPIAIIPIETTIAIIQGTMSIAVVAVGTIDMAVIPIGTVIAVIAVPVATVISTAIYTPIMSAVDAIVGLRLVHRQ